MSIEEEKPMNKPSFAFSSPSFKGRVRQKSETKRLNQPSFRQHLFDLDQSNQIGQAWSYTLVRHQRSFRETVLLIVADIPLLWAAISVFFLLHGLRTVVWGEIITVSLPIFIGLSQLKCMPHLSLPDKQDRLKQLTAPIPSPLQMAQDMPHSVNAATDLRAYLPAIDTGPLLLRPAWQHELAKIVDLLLEAAHWTTSRGYKQWSADDFLHPAHWRFLEQKARRGELYLVEHQSQIVGTIILQEPDRIDQGFWKEKHAEALYVHRLAVRRAFAGKKIGYALLSWAQDMAAARAGKQYLRLDCLATNPDLCAYYERFGFTCRGVVGRKRKARLYEISARRSSSGAVSERAREKALFI